MSETTQNDARKKKRKTPWRQAFLAVLSRIGTVTAAALAAGIERKTAYRCRERSPDFARAWNSSLETFADHLEEVALERALRGVPKFKFHKGKPLPHPLLCQCGHHKVDHNQGPCQQEGCPCTLFTNAPYSEQETSDVLLIFLLKGHRPEKYRDHLGMSQEEVDELIEVRLKELVEARLAQLGLNNGEVPRLPPPVPVPSSSAAAAASAAPPESTTAPDPDLSAFYSDRPSLQPPAPRRPPAPGP
jgi:hypothetical protein